MSVVRLTRLWEARKRNLSLIPEKGNKIFSSPKRDTRYGPTHLRIQKEHLPEIKLSVNLTTTGHIVPRLSMGGPLCILPHSLPFCAQTLTYRSSMGSIEGLCGEGDTFKFILRKYDRSV